MNLPNPYGNTRFVPGVGWVEPSVPSQYVPGSLGDDASVMMISGLGAATDWKGSGPAPWDVGYGSVLLDPQRQNPPAKGTAFRPFGIQLPMWAWLLIAAGLLGAGYYFFGKKR